MTYPMKKLWISALLIATLAAGSVAQAQGTKKELIQKLLLLQQPGLESMARELAGRPAMQLMQAANNVLQTQVPPDKREAVGKSIEADLKKYVDEATPVIRDRATKLAPLVYGASLEEKFSEDELKQLIAWFESPVNHKFQQLGPEMQNGFMQKLVAETAPLLDPKLQATQQKLRATLGLPPAAAASAPKPAAAPTPKPAAKPASK
jgi:hypothetical protein